MKRRKTIVPRFLNYLPLTVAVFLTTRSSEATFTVTQDTAANVVAALIPGGSGLTTSSISSVGNSAQRGTFTASSGDAIGGAGSPLTSGIILSAGTATDADQAATVWADTQFSGPADAVIAGFTGQVSKDASSVTFIASNANAATVRITFLYTFATEETLYNEGAYISVDGTPVVTRKVSTASFTGNWSSSVWVYDRYTATASVDVDVPGGSSRTIKIAVSDSFDEQYDSAILIQSQFQSLPTVSVAASQDAYENANNETWPYPSEYWGYFLISRTGSTASSLYVTYGFDVVTSADFWDFSDCDSCGYLGATTIPAGYSSVLVPIYPEDDFDTESTEQIYIVLDPGATYGVADDGPVSINIYDND